MTPRAGLLYIRAPHARKISSSAAPASRILHIEEVFQSMYFHATYESKTEGSWICFAIALQCSLSAACPNCSMLEINTISGTQALKVEAQQGDKVDMIGAKSRYDDE